MAKKAKVKSKSKSSAEKTIVTSEDLEKYESQFRGWAAQLSVARQSLKEMKKEAVEVPSWASFKLGVGNVSTFLGKLQTSIYDD